MPPRAMCVRRSARTRARNSPTSGLCAVQLLAALRARVVGGDGASAVHPPFALILSGRGEVGAEALHRLADAAAHLVGDEPHRVGESGLDALEVARAGLDLGVAGLGDLRRPSCGRRRILVTRPSSSSLARRG